MADSIQINTLTLLAGTWQREADSGVRTPAHREALRECADALRMLCETVFERTDPKPATDFSELEAVVADVQALRSAVLAEYEPMFDEIMDRLKKAIGAKP